MLNECHEGIKIIIIIDDEIDDLKLLSQTLESSGYRVVVIKDTKAALTSVTEIQPDLILLATEMHETDVYELCRSIKAAPRMENIPVIFICEEGGDEVKLKAFSAGGADYLTKPFLQEEVLVRVDTYLNLASLQCQLVDKVRELEKVKEKLQDDNFERVKTGLQLKLLSRAVENSPATVVITNAQGNIEYINRKFTSLTGYTFEEVLDGNPRILKSGIQTTDFYKDLWNTIASGKEWQGEFHNKKKNGELYWESARISPIFDEDGNITHFIALKEDITERKKAEEALRQNKERLELALEGAGLGTWNWDLESRKLIFSQRWAELFGYSLDELEPSDSTVNNLIHPDDLPRAQEVMSMHLKGLIPEYRVEYRIRAKSGEWRWSLAIGKAIESDSAESPRRVIGVNMDITEQKQVESALIASQKLSGIGTLAAGVAHELNSPLQVITGTSESLLKHLSPEDDTDFARLRLSLEMINRNGWRAANVVRALRIFLADNPINQKSFESVNEIITDALLLVQHKVQFNKTVEIKCELDNNLPSIKCDRNQILQVVINLLLNAIDAIESNGEIVVVTKPGLENHTIELVIKDDGQGISEEILPRIFDPFFTTKPIGEGQGLGLSVILGIVRTHSGKIEVESEPGKGSTFIVTFPIDQDTLPIKVENYPKRAGRYDDSIIN